jgi:hypothetical protein
MLSYTGYNREDGGMLVLLASKIAFLATFKQKIEKILG